jgi:hypothetical protein
VRIKIQGSKNEGMIKNKGKEEGGLFQTGGTL